MMPLAMPEVSFEITGVEDAIRRAAEAQLQQTQFARRSVVIATGGERGAAKNAMIAEVQAKNGRNPFYVPDNIRQQLRFMVRGVTSVDPDTRKAALWQIGELLMATVKANVTAQRHKSGSPFRALTPAYAKLKQRTHGFIVPILRATGDLLDGLRVRIEDF